MTATVLFGLATCDSCRKAQRWLKDNQRDFSFHDVRRDGLTIQMLERWADAVGWERLVNRKSLTWRKIPSLDRDNLDRNRALALLLENPTLLKRPVLEIGADVVVGFDAAAYAAC
ncbi:MAG: Spx/MgsR family RNA polymerase-binding regulatory protein [Pseudomonadota bacterium]